MKIAPRRSNGFTRQKAVGGRFRLLLFKLPVLVGISLRREYIIDFLSLENEEQLIYYHIIRPDGSFVIQNDNTELWYFFEQLQKQLNATANELSVENSIKEFGAALKNHDEYSTSPSILDGV